ncbi:hypothetical protein LIER_23294 [Lithospermum erythrorhizon]|uniref:Uncharacterized protein n=1 Tax=Lithospermum erythrorhizon TaxID=34254 RepID=A0AAV3R0C8_LITER
MGDCPLWMPTKQEKGKGKKPVKQSKRKAKAKRGETSGVADDIEGAVDPVVGATDPIQQQAPNVDASEEIEDSFVEGIRERATRRGRGFAKGFRASRPAPIEWVDHNEADDIVDILSLPEKSQNDASDVEILKVVQDTTIDPSVSQRETRRAKHTIVKHKYEQAKKKRRKS